MKPPGEVHSPGGVLGRAGAGLGRGCGEDFEASPGKGSTPAPGIINSNGHGCTAASSSDRVPSWFRAGRARVPRDFRVCSERVPLEFRSRPGPAGGGRGGTADVARTTWVGAAQCNPASCIAAPAAWPAAGAGAPPLTGTGALPEAAPREGAGLRGLVTPRPTGPTSRRCWGPPPPPGAPRRPFA